MRTTTRCSALAATIVSLLLAAPGGAAARTFCVGSGAGCDATIQAAVDRTGDGDVVRVSAGHFHGGVQILRSITLAGAGAGATVIEGGGPVITVGRWEMAKPPTVAISGVTVTGGVSTSSPQSVDWTGGENVIATGGGIEVPGGANGGPGAALTVTDSVITGNRAAPTDTRPFGPTCPDGKPCAFAFARGGGIDAWGRLTLVRTTVSANEASGVASDANGGGVFVWSGGSLTMRASDVTGNRALASAPFGRFAEGGGIAADNGTWVTIDGGSVSGNRAALTSHLPYFVDGADPLELNANGGGLHAGDGVAVTVTNSHFDDNVVAVDNPEGEAVGFDSGLRPGPGPTVLRNVTLNRNVVTVNVGSTEDSGPSGSAIDLGNAKVSATSLTGNVSEVTSADGQAAVAGAIYADNQKNAAALLDHVTISDNRARAEAASGGAVIDGVGLTSEGVLRISDSVISGNSGEAVGTTSSARGGGIFNALVFESAAPKLTLQNTRVTGNSLTADSTQGGGIYTAFPISLLGSVVTQNAPDDCSGC